MAAAAALGLTRYFVVKAPRANIIISQAQGLWATHHRRQPALLAACAEARVVLLFSALSTHPRPAQVVNRPHHLPSFPSQWLPGPGWTMTQRFQGFATIVGAPEPGGPPAPWECSKRVAASLGDCFPVRWEAVCNEASDEGNPWNGDKPVWGRAWAGSKASPLA